MNEIEKVFLEIQEGDELTFCEKIKVKEIGYQDGQVYVSGTNREGFVYYAQITNKDGPKLELIEIRR